MHVRFGGVVLGLLLTACTPHDYRHRIDSTYQGHRYIYYCDSIAQDRDGLYFKNSNGSIVRIPAGAAINHYKDEKH